ncbi:hypothetical protein IAU60_000105 [Kwoniella sp. DSM 27419]
MNSTDQGLEGFLLGMTPPDWGPETAVPLIIGGMIKGTEVATGLPSIFYVFTDPATGHQAADETMKMSMLVGWDDMIDCSESTHNITSSQFLNSADGQTMRDMAVAMAQGDADSVRIHAETLSTRDWWKTMTTCDSLRCRTLSARAALLTCHLDQAGTNPNLYGGLPGHPSYGTHHTPWPTDWEPLQEASTADVACINSSRQLGTKATPWQSIRMMEAASRISARHMFVGGADDAPSCLLPVQHLEFPCSIGTRDHLAKPLPQAPPDEARLALLERGRIKVRW